MSSESDCVICSEPYNKRQRKEVTCDFCNYSACRQCIEEWFTEKKQEIVCLNCKKPWTRKMLVEKFTKKFVNEEYRDLLEEIYFEREKALLPAAQDVIERNKSKNKWKKKIKEIDEEMKLLKLKKLELQGKINAFDFLVDEKKERKVFTRKCPADDCRGFLSSRWKCGLCNTKVCSDCHEIKEDDEEDEHECKQENVESAKAIEKETKACPKCSARIYKIDGCVHMFCTQCITSFHWTTMEITKHNSNPHYHEWLRRNGETKREVGDMPCGRELGFYFVQNLVRIGAPENALEVVRRIEHINTIDLPHFQINRNTDNQKLHIQYLQNEIDEDDFKSKLQKKVKEVGKKEEISGILNMFVVTCTDIFYRYYNESIDKKTDYEIYELELKGIVEYTNECLDEVSDIWKCKKYEIVDFKLNRGTDEQILAARREERRAEREADRLALRMQSLES